jgi:hypothetical protein
LKVVNVRLSVQLLALLLHGMAQCFDLHYPGALMRSAERMVVWLPRQMDVIPRALLHPLVLSRFQVPADVYCKW